MSWPLWGGTESRNNAPGAAYHSPPRFRPAPYARVSRSNVPALLRSCLRIWKLVGPPPLTQSSHTLFLPREDCKPLQIKRPLLLFVRPFVPVFKPLARSALAQWSPLLWPPPASDRPYQRTEFNICGLRNEPGRLLPLGLV